MSSIKIKSEGVVMVFFLKMAKNPHAMALGRLGGKARAKNLSKKELVAISEKAGRVGGQARAAKLTAGKRKAIARAAAAARWAKRRPAK